MFRRLIMANQAKKEYISDGLVLHLDGIDKGGVSGRWTSLVGSAYYTLTDHSIVEDKAIVMDGAGFIRGTNVPAIRYDTGTIELCATRLTIATSIVVFGQYNMLAVAFSSNGVSFGSAANGANDNKWGFDTTQLQTFTSSFNQQHAVVNGDTIAGTTIRETWGTNGVATIGGRAMSSYWYSNIRIYSIRMYNRQLTAEEMLYNQQVDNERFNLGLNI